MVLAVGEAIEFDKDIGDPEAVAERLHLAARGATHAVTQTRMETGRAVTTERSHPFSTGPYTYLVHSGPISTYNHLRERLRRRGETFQTENDS